MSRSTKDPLERAAGLFDATCLRILKKGVRVVLITTDSAGHTQQAVGTVDPSAAYLSVIRGRLRDCQMTAVATAGSTLDKLQGEVGRMKLGPLPPHSDEIDAATA